MTTLENAWALPPYRLVMEIGPYTWGNIPCEKVSLKTMLRMQAWLKKDYYALNAPSKIRDITSDVVICPGNATYFKT